MRTNWTIRAACLAAAGIQASVATAPAAAQSQTTARYALPSQDLEETLRAIARLAGREILFPDEAVRGRKAPAITGRLTIEQAIRAAIAGTGLVVEEHEGALMVREGPEASQSDSNATTTITVTGTRIRGADGASPVIVTTRRTLEDQGIADLTGFSRTIPQNYTGGQNPGVAGGGDQGGQNNINNATTLNLRGLGADATLTLINGHRLPYDALNQGVDIATVPLVAIERIEIVADGASALYGSDAVGGVANIRLRRDYDGIQASARLAAAWDGGADQQQYSILGGARWASGGFMGAIDYSKASPITAGDRRYTQNLDPSQMLSTRSEQTSAVLAGHQRLAPGATLEIDVQFADRESSKANAFFVTSDATTNGQINTPRVQSYAITPVLRFELGSGWEAELQGTHGKSRTEIASRRILNRIETPSRLLYQNWLTNIEASAEGPLFELPGGDARLVFGGGARWFAIDIKSSTTSAGITRTTRNASEDRQSLFGYGELSLPLVGPANRTPLIQALRLSAAVRYEHYAGIDAVATPKLGLVYAPHRDVTLKFSWGKSFKIPTLNQVNQVREGALFPGSFFVPRPVPPLAAGSTVLALSGGNPDLEAERATNMGASIEIRPLDGLRIEASYFDIDYQGRIASPVTNILAALGDPLSAAFVTLSPTQQQIADLIASLPLGLSNQSGQPYDPARVAAIIDATLRNTAHEHARGVDVAIDYSQQLGAEGQLTLGAAASYLDADRQLQPSQPVVPRAGIIFTPPHFRARGTAAFEMRAIQFATALNYVGSTSDKRFPIPAEIGSFTTIDLSAALRPTVERGPLRDLELRLSVQNLLNQQPSMIRTTDPAAIPFDSTNQSPVGRLISIAVTKQW